MKKLLLLLALTVLSCSTDNETDCECIKTVYQLDVPVSVEEVGCVEEKNVYINNQSYYEIVCN